jgi:allophanate hydrolase
MEISLGLASEFLLFFRLADKLFQYSAAITSPQGARMSISLDFTSLTARYVAGDTTPVAVIQAVYERIALNGQDGVWISLVPKEVALSRAKALTALSKEQRDQLPLFGLPFNVKDNIDVKGLATTAACPGFSYHPNDSAPVVEHLEKAGAILIGKTNLDQFATGLVGTRSPYGIPRNAFDASYIPGGSSSGAGVSVASGLSSFAIGTDTGGSGRVPASFNNVVGIKPTRGRLSLRGCLPANRSLDCLAVFALTVEDGTLVRQIAEQYDAQDPWSRRLPLASPGIPQRFRFAIPDEASLDFLGDDANAHLFQQAIKTLEQLGGTPVPIDYTPFLEINALLFNGAFIAERAASLRALPGFDGKDILDVLRAILERADRLDAQAAFSALHRLKALRRQAETVLDRTDVLVVPTTPTIWTIEQVEADPIARNFALGRYTNFVNFLDLAAIAVPAGFRPNGLPAGITIAGPAFSDNGLSDLADRYLKSLSLPLGAPQ